MTGLICLFLGSLSLLTTPALADDGENGGTVEYDGGFVFKSADGKFKTKLGSRVQVRFESEIPTEEGPAEHAVYVPRARIALSGHAFTKALGYKFQADWGKGGASLKDYYVDYKPSDSFMIRGGQFKRPFNRHQLNSSSKLALVDRSFTDKHFGTGRDLGVMAHNGLTKVKGFEYALGVFNGTGDKPSTSGSVLTDLATGEGEIEEVKASNVPDMMHPMVVLRGGANNGGKEMYDSVDMKGGDFRGAVAANAVLDLDVPDADAGGIVTGIDGMIKVSGFTWQVAGFMSMAQAGASWGDQEMADIGVHTEANYLVNNKVAPGVRFAQVVGDDGDSSQQEITVGTGVYLFGGHKVKWDNDASYLTETEGDESESAVRIRSQLQFSF